jgi:hypothetical protein
MRVTIAIPGLDLLKEYFRLADFAVGSFSLGSLELLFNPHLNALLVHKADGPPAIARDYH